MKLVFLNIFMGVIFFVLSLSAKAFNPGIPLGGGHLKECSRFQQKKVGSDLQAAINKALTIKRICERAEMLYSIAFVASGTRDFQDFTAHGPRNGFRGSAIHEINQRKLVETLIQAKDTVETINQANIYLDLYPNNKYRRTIHYYLVLAQNMRIRPAGNGQKDTYIALGLNDDQQKYQITRNIVKLASGTQIALGVKRVANSNLNIHQYRRSFNSYLDAYENTGGDDIEQVYQMYDTAAIRAQEKEFDVGMQYYKQKEYIAAIGRFKNVTNAGPVFGLANGGRKIWDIWDKSAYFTALSFMEMGKALLGLRTHTQFFTAKPLQTAIESVVWHLNKRSMLITDQRIAHWLGMRATEYTPGKNGHPTRHELARVCFKNAGLIVNELQNQRQSSKYKRKAIQDLNKKVDSNLRQLVPDIEALLNL